MKSSDLNFGTGGVRGIMGVGANRINRYTIRHYTQALANYLNKQPKTSKELSVIIGYDSRHHSREFAEESAVVLARNHIRVYIYSEMRPTPLVSFGCRYKKCSSAIMITASHNPPQYNGFKVFWNDGSQLSYPHDQGIIDEVKKITDMDRIIYTDIKSPLIEWIGDEIDAEYLNAIFSMQLYPQDNKNQGHSLKVVYTSLHGTGITLMPKALQSWGFSNREFVKEQIIPDGNFPTCKSPNPEESEALKLGIEMLLKVEGDILIATDPDADRVGLVINHHGNIHTFNGNQIACLLLHHILEALSTQNCLPKNGVFIKTLVTTELFTHICNDYGKECINVLPGFKYVAEKIREWENSSTGYQFIFGGEESYGYLYGTHVRDKDAIICSLLICEMALQAKLQNKTLCDLLHDLWKKYGVYVETLRSIKFEESKIGKEQMSIAIANIQKNFPRKIDEVEVLIFEDYLTSTRIDLRTDQKKNYLYLSLRFLYSTWQIAVKLSFEVRELSLR